MQRMRPDVPPEPLQPNFPSRNPRTRDLKHPARDLQRRIRRHDFHAGDPLRHLPPLLGGDVPLGAVVGVDACELGAGAVGERFGGAQVGEEGAVALQDVGF